MKEKNKFKCDIYEYICSQKGQMKQHASSVHEGNKPLKSEYFSHSHYAKDILNNHVATVHE